MRSPDNLMRGMRSTTFKTAKRSPADDIEMDPTITTSLGSFWKGIFFAFSIVTCSKGCESPGGKAKGQIKVVSVYQY